MRTRSLVLSLCLALAAPPLVIAGASVAGCAGFLAAAPMVASLVSDGVAILGMVESAVSSWYRSHPSADDSQAKIAAGIQRAQAALVLGGQLLAGVESATQGQTSQAFAAFAAAWSDLMALVAPLGILPAQQTVLPIADASTTIDGGVRASRPVLLAVPTPLAVRAVRR